MTIQRSQSPQANEATQRREAAENALAKREPPPAEQVERFRAVMDQLRDGEGDGGELGREARLTGAAAQQQADAAAQKDALRSDAVLDAVVRDAAVHRADDPGLLASTTTATTLDPAQLWQAQGALRGGDAAVQVPTPSGAANALADLVERHVRQLAVGGGTTTAEGDGQVLLRMADATLPGTDLVLSRDAGGWVLRADVRSRESYDAITEAGPGLAKRFAERNLGELRIESHFNG